MFEKIISIEKIGEEESYDLEVDSKYHNYYANNICVSNSTTYSYISWQTLFFKVYYPSYFYAAMLNMEDKEDKIQEIIDDAKKNAVEILPLSISKSQFYCTAENDMGVRLGYKLIRGVGDKVEDELKELEMHKCNTMDEIMQKPFKKLNNSALNNLIRLGCFDEFGVERSMIVQLKEIYKEPKIEKWFSRKRSPAEEKTMPEILSTNFDISLVMGFVPEALDSELPHITLVKLLTPHLKAERIDDPDARKIKLQKETIAAELELLGFSISIDDSFNDFARAYKSLGFNSISDLDENDPKCYFKVIKITDLKTKTGKVYWQYLLNDGRKDYKAKVWRQNPQVTEGSCCVGVIEYDQRWGFTLIHCEFIKK